MPKDTRSASDTLRSLDDREHMVLQEVDRKEEEQSSPSKNIDTSERTGWEADDAICPHLMALLVATSETLT
jgi:hypothetical protein